jgi:ribosomal protein L14E/L6E/L27E
MFSTMFSAKGAVMVSLAGPDSGQLAISVSGTDDNLESS